MLKNTFKIPLYGIDLIAEERYEQITKHKKTIAKDVEENKNSELFMGALAVLEGSIIMYPSNWDVNVIYKMNQKPYKERLVIAGALIAAEIDRLQAVETLKEKTTV